MSQRLYRSARTGDLETFVAPYPGPASGWELVGVVQPISAPGGGAERQQLLDQQEQLAARERRQHGNLLKTRNTLDELACRLDLLAEAAPYDATNFVATPERILAAQARAEGKLPIPLDAPPQAQPRTKMTATEAIALFEKVQRQRRGEI